MRAGDLLAAEIFGPVERHERPLAQPPESLAHCGFEQQPLHVREARREQRRVRAVEHVSDIVVRRDLLDAEQSLTVGPTAAFLQLALKGQKRRALHEKHGEGRQPEIGHADIAAAALARVRKASANRLQAGKKRRQNLHPQRESCFR